MEATEGAGLDEDTTKIIARRAATTSGDRRLDRRATRRGIGCPPASAARRSVDIVHFAFGRLRPAEPRVARLDDGLGPSGDLQLVEDHRHVVADRLRAE